MKDGYDVNGNSQRGLPQQSRQAKTKCTLTVLEARGPRSRCLHGRLLLRPLSLVCAQPLLAVSSYGISSVRVGVCVQFPLLLRTHSKLRPILMTSS